LLSSGKSLQPQSWNRYTYCLNQPLKLVDPKGLIWGVASWEEDGKTVTEYRWFNKIGKKGANYGGHNYAAVKFGNGGRGSLDVPDDAGNVIRISNYGHVYQVVYTGPKGDGPSTGQGNLNASVGLVDGLLPFGKQFREAAFGKMGVDTSAPEYQNASAISAGVTTGALLLTGAGEAELAEEGTTTLYRAVKQPELEDILESGTYRIAQAQREGKYFFETAEDATEFGQKMFGKFPQEGSYTVTSAEVDRAVIQASSPLKAAGEGPARFVPANRLPIGPVKIGP